MRCFRKVIKFCGFWVGILFASFSLMEQKQSLSFSVKLRLRLTTKFVF